MGFLFVLYVSSNSTLEIGTEARVVRDVGTKFTIEGDSTPVSEEFLGSIDSISNSLVQSLSSLCT
jgi:hypothetical protein